MDTNVLVSGLLTRRAPPWRVIEAVIRGEAIAYATEDILEEYARVMERIAFLISRDTDTSFGIYRRRLVLVASDQDVRRSRDPDDDKFLACAAACDADYLVTGDRDLLVLQRHGRASIITPNAFASIMT